MKSKKETAVRENEVDDLIKNFGVPPPDHVKTKLRKSFEAEREAFLRLEQKRKSRTTEK